MAKKTLSKKEKVGMLADKLSAAIDSCKLEPTEELDIFAEAVALLIAYWGKVSEWTPLEGQLCWLCHNDCHGERP